MPTLLFSLLFILNAEPCEKAVRPTRFFSEFAIAKAIEELGAEGRIFSAVIRGYYYDQIAKRYSITEAEVEAIAFKGIDIVWKYKKEGL